MHKERKNLNYNIKNIVSLVENDRIEKDSLTRAGIYSFAIYKHLLINTDNRGGGI